MTDTHLLDKTLARVARLEAALAITGGTVHDAANLLTVLSGTLYMLTEAVRGNSALYEKARRARNSADKCGSLMRELLTFSRGSDDAARSICPARHVRALEPLLRRAIPQEHALDIRPDMEPWSVAASAAQYESALTNLVINARDALSGQGTIDVRVENIRLDEPLAARLQVAPGDYVRTGVIDNGAGIPADILPRIAEPLFTTKNTGSGSGLGLSMVQRFARQCGGLLSIRSAEGRGTAVQMLLPRSGAQAELTANMTMPLATLAGGEETVIVVSKDEGVRAAIRDILGALGYTVVLAAMGKSIAHQHCTEQPPSILVCERSARHRRAEQRWIGALRRRNPSLRQVAVLEPDAVPGRVAPDADTYLYRPIAINELARAMRDAAETNDG